MFCTCPCHRDPIVESAELGVEERRLVPGVRLRICNVPTIVRTGGHEPGERRYYTRDTAKQLESLHELARLRARPGDTEVCLDFREDATLGRLALHDRIRRQRDHYRKRYDARMRTVPRFGSSDYYYERLHPASGPGAEGHSRLG
jgi:hypothetical protein